MVVFTNKSFSLALQLSFLKFAWWQGAHPGGPCVQDCRRRAGSSGKRVRGYSHGFQGVLSVLLQLVFKSLDSRSLHADSLIRPCESMPSKFMIAYYENDGRNGFVVDCLCHTADASCLSAERGLCFSSLEYRWEPARFRGDYRRCHAAGSLQGCDKTVDAVMPAKDGLEFSGHSITKNEFFGLDLKWTALASRSYMHVFTQDEENPYRHRNVAKLLFIHMLGYPTVSAMHTNHNPCDHPV